MASTPVGPSAKGGMDAFWRDDFAPLNAAGKSVLAALREDEEAPDADLYRRIVSSGPGSHLYYRSTIASLPDAGARSPGSTPRVPPTPNISHLRSVPLPHYLAQELKKTRFRSLMGLFPEADLAWMSVDERLYLWSYSSSPGSSATNAGGIENFCTFVIPSEQLVASVGLVRPKKGVFIDIVEWCLVVTTREEAILCALARSDGEANAGESGFAHRQGALRLIPTRYIVPTDSVPLLSVCGTSDGRIFMGGSDGCLYEMSYEGLVDPLGAKPPSLESRLDAFYDGGDSGEGFDQINGNSSIAKKIVTGSKRALTSMMFASNGSETRPRKCRKLNHSSHASSLVTAVVPGILMKASSCLFGAGRNSTAGGPIIRLLVDEERTCIYTLSSKGWICVFDVNPQCSTSIPQAKLMAVMDTAKTARLYLKAVSQGQMYPPSSSLANITFPGGGASAQAGVGGMEGARSILRLAVSEEQRERNTPRDGKKLHDEGVLTPTSIHLVPRKESGRLTLVAVTRGGLRYYLSSLSSSVLNTGTAQHIGSNTKSDPLAPSSKFTLFHIRAPPPVGENGLVQEFPSFETDSISGVGGLIPKIAVSGGKVPSVQASYYESGVSVVALECKGAQASALTAGDIVVAATPDSVMRKKETPTTGRDMTMAQSPVLSAPGGVSETLHQPTATLSDSSSVERAPTLPGGRVWAINASASPERSVLMLTLSSQTPTDSELSIGLVPAYFPPSRVRSQREATGTASDKSQGSYLNIAEASTSDSVVASNSRGSASSIAFTILTNFLLSRPLRHGLTFQRTLPQLENGTGSGTKVQRSYRISNRYGFGEFNVAAAGSYVQGRSGRKQTSLVSVARSQRDTAGSTSKAARLSQWQVDPAVVPLNPLSVQHLIPSNDIVALNAGGLHYFQYSTILSNLTEAIMSAGVNIGRDETITSFFKSYGYKQGCAMCLSLAVGCCPGKLGGSYGRELRERALQAALARGKRPQVVHISNRSNGVTVEQPQNTDAAVPPGYEFHPSALVDGFTALLSRLLRPVWYKPAVVVTEGRTIRKRGGGTTNTPARVELLLDDVSLEEIRKPLYDLQALMRDAFSPAVNVVPGVQRRDSDVLDIDDDNCEAYDLFTRAMQHQGLVRGQINGISGTESRLTSTEMDTMARLIEERNLHSLYRLLSRTVQLLSLLALLKQAQLMADLPEVEWGLLHGLTISQLVQTQKGQERIENVLNSLVSSTASAASAVIPPSADADKLAEHFATQCYLFFSPGSRLAYLGFRSANAALSCLPSSTRRASLTKQASDFLKRAAGYWYSPQMITGRILHSKDGKSYEQLALRAMQFDSPVAKAAAALMQLENVEGLVQVCLETASNFGERRPSQKLLHHDVAAGPGDAKPADMLWWEHGLYHRRREPGEKGPNPISSPAAGAPASSSTSALAVGADVTPDDAVRTCHAIIFHHLSMLLDSSNTHLADRMVEECEKSSDKDFLQALYAHLLSTNHVDTLLQSKSSEVEKWLTRHADTTMLWSYYVRHEKNVQAGEVMWRRAKDVERAASLGERLEYLTRARDSFISALQQEPPIADREQLQGIITKVCETLDVAILQDRVLNTVSGTLRDELNDEQFSKLSSELVTVSDLFNEYAAPLNLFDLCLLIVHSCQRNEVDAIDKLWKSIFCEEVLPCTTRSSTTYNFLQELMTQSMVDERIDLIPENGDNGTSAPLFENGDWMNALKGRVVSLGKEVYGKGAGYAFPVDFIASNLEGLRRACGSSRPWPIHVLVEVGVPYSAIFEAYEGMVEREDRVLMGGVDLQRRMQHLSSVIDVLQEWISAADPFRHGSQNDALVELSRAATAGGLVSRIDSYKNSLEGVIGGRESDAVAQMCQTLDDIDNAIKRIV